MDTLVTVRLSPEAQAVGVKIIHGAGRWGVRYPAFKQPSFALVLKGSCLLTVKGMPATTLETGDFVLFPAMPEFILRSDPEVLPRLMKPAPSEEQVEEVFSRRRLGGARAPLERFG